MVATSAPPPSLDQLKGVAEKYAPILRFHPDEQYFPCTVEWYLQHSTLLGPNGYIKKSPLVTDLPGGTDDSKWALNIDDAVKPGNLSTACTYVHAFYPPGATYYDIQYWFCFGYNGSGTLNVTGNFNGDVNLAPLGEHWVDWEMVSVRINIATQEPLHVYLSQHGGGQLVTDLSVFQREGEQFIVYASKNNHALYPHVGINPTESCEFVSFKFFLRNDTADGGKALDTYGRVIIASVDFLPNSTAQWMKYPYRWGLGSDSHLTLQAVEEVLQTIFGPLGPPGNMGAALEILAISILPRIKFDDTNGVYGPQTQSYWNGSYIPDFVITTGYTSWNTQNKTPPSIAFFKGKYHVIFRAHQGNGIMQIQSPDGFPWSNLQNTGFNCSGAPFVVVYRNVLHVYFRDSNGNGLLHMQSTDGVKWTPAPQMYMKIDIDSQPTATVLNGDTLCAVGVDAGGNGIMYSVQKDLNGTSASGYTGWNTNENTPPCVVAFQNAFHCFFQDHYGKGIMHLTSTDGVQWKQAKNFYIGYATSAGPCAVVLDGQLYLFFRDGNGNGILHVRTSDGEKWVVPGNWYIGLTCDDAPRAAISDDQRSLCIVATDSNGNGIMKALLLPW